MSVNPPGHWQRTGRGARFMLDKEHRLVSVDLADMELRAVAKGMAQHAAYFNQAPIKWGTSYAVAMAHTALLEYNTVAKSKAAYDSAVKAGIVFA